MQNFYEVRGLQVQKWLQEMWCNCRQVSRKKRQILLLAVKPGPAPRPSAPKCQDCDRIFKPCVQTAFPCSTFIGYSMATGLVSWKKCRYSGFHFFCSKLWTAADASSFALKLREASERMCHGVPSSPVSKRMRKGRRFLTNIIRQFPPLKGSFWGVTRHKFTLYSRYFDMSGWMGEVQ